MTSLNLNGLWRLRPLQGKNAAAIDAEVPGSVMGAWLKAGLIPDPFYGENEKAVSPLFDNDFEYSRTFTANAELLAEDKVELACQGIDTLAEIFINDKSAARVNNMHRSWRFDVKDFLKAGENAIRIVISSPSAFIAKAYREGKINFINTGTLAGSNYLRKAHCQFGWDWGPQLPDMGIWRGICLEGWSAARLADVYITQDHSKAANGKVIVKAKARAETADLKRFWAEGGSLKATLKVSPPQGKASSAETLAVTEIIPDVLSDTELSLVIENPELWQPNGLAEKRAVQPLYTVRVELLDAKTGKVLDQWERRIGLRTLTFSTEKDQWGSEFALTVNGVKVFAMGADYIPEDAVFSRISRERTRRLLEDCAKANFNCVRVWGGGYYPDDYFYDACDELGLVVWQDFMFACNVYELTDEFAANVAEEIRQNVSRIRHHACLGLWCGNNEMEVAWAEWPGVVSQAPAFKADYIKLFEGIIPAICKETDPQTFYWPASPSSGGGFDAPNAPDRGDVHYWEVWHGLKPFSDYRKYFFRYCSEFGFQSLPDMETIRAFAREEDLNLFSPVMEAHQRNPGGNGKILYYLSQTYRYPKDFASLAYVSQILQLESIQTGVDHWRRNRGRCMGAVYWQLNDYWPVISWASVDYFGRWKALHYGARRFFSPLRVTVFIDETEAAPPGALAGPLMRTARVFVHNDTVSPASGKFRLRLRYRDFTIISEDVFSVEMPALSAHNVFTRNFSEIVNNEEIARSCYVTAELEIDGVPQGKETALFVPPKHFSFKRPKYDVEIMETGADFIISVQADTFCRFVRVKIGGEDPVFSDNYFDITGAEGVKITAPKAELRNAYTPQALRYALLNGGIISVADTC
ncbi:MAG: glycoside hydrolase family 2 protein [Treponema sp.]|jgi:beta-mannosidase|nr:glycoside hydrolase family 2 protein [Treponema sp.]